MHLAILNQYYWPHGSATSQLITELAESLSSRGHRVSVVTASIADDAARGSLPRRETRNGVEIHRVPATRRGKASIANRMLDYGTFYAGAIAALGALRPRPDVVLALTTPPLVAAASQLIGLVRRYPTVSLVQDVYPDIAVALGVVAEGSAIHRVWSAATGISLRATRHVVVLSEAMRRRIRGYSVPDSRIETIPNWALEELDANATGDQKRLVYGFGDRFVVMYSGNMGAGHSFDTLLDAAKHLEQRQDIVFAFVGDGVRHTEIADGIASRGLANVTMLPFAPREELAESLAAGDLHVVTMGDGIQGLLMPSKLYGILGASRPVLFVGPADSAVRSTVAAADAGESCINGDIDGVVKAITAMADAPDRGRAVGERGRTYLDAKLDRETAVTRYETLLTSVARTSRRRLRRGAPSSSSLAAS
jgi:colanic acid biosynthesis glycosyl transferase WcaI